MIGAGGVGGTFGAALARAGADVTFVARGTHLDAMLTHGLVVKGGRGETHLVPTKATSDPASIGKVDVVLFCVKLWDVESAGAQIKPLIGPETGVIPLQNGVDAAERLAPILGREAVMGGVAQISASITAPGLITQVTDRTPGHNERIERRRSRAVTQSPVPDPSGSNFDVWPFATYCSAARIWLLTAYMGPTAALFARNSLCFLLI